MFLEQQSRYWRGHETSHDKHIGGKYMGLTLERLIFDPSDANNSPNIGAYLRAGSDGDQLTSTLISGKECLDVNVVGDADDGIFDEDSAHTSTDKGQHILAVRKDVQGSLVDADGDYGSLQLDSEGRLRTITDVDLLGDLTADGDVDNEDPLKMGSHAYDQSSVWGSVDAGDKANLASDVYRRIIMNDAPNLEIKASAVSVGLTAVNLTSTPIAGRMRINIQNNGDKSIFIGHAAVTTSTGIEVSKGSTLSMEIGEGINPYAISTAAAQDVRVLELG